jgi:hypothetical protein
VSFQGGPDPEQADGDGGLFLPNQEILKQPNKLA